METKLEDLRKWFGKGKKGDWVRVGTDGEIKGDCAREPGEGKPKCMPRSKAHSMSKKDRASAARRKRRADPMVDRPGTGNTPIMVKTDKKESVEMNEAPKVPAGMKFIASYVYKDANGNDHTHRHLRKGSKMSDPVVVYIDGKEWKTFQSFTKSKQAAINHIKGMKESVDMNESTMADRQVVKAVRIAKDMGGNMTGAVRRIEKMKKGLSDHPKVKAALRLANETYKPDPDGGNHKAVKAAQTRAKIAKYNAQTRKANNESVEMNENKIFFVKVGDGRDSMTVKTKAPNSSEALKKVRGQYPKDRVSLDRNQKQGQPAGALESVDLEEKNVPTNPALWAKFKAQAKAKFDVYPSAYANGWAAKKYKAAGGGWKTESVKEMKSFHELREGKVSAKFTDHSPNKDFNDLAKKNRLKVTHDKNSEVTTVHGDEKGVLSLLKTMYGNDWKYMYTKKGSTYVDESVKEAVGDTALAFQTPQGTVTATKRNTKGMRGKQDAYSLSLKTKSGKTVDLGSHPNPTKANVMSIAKNVMS